MSTFYSSWTLDYPSRERKGWEIENKRMDKVRGTEGKALPWALRRTQRDQEEAVSVCACMSLFVRKRKGGRKREIACVHWRISESVCMQVYLFLCTVYSCVYTFVGAWVGVWVQSVMFVDSEHWLKKCTGALKISRKTADNSKTKLCLSGSSPY